MTAMPATSGHAAPARSLWLEQALAAEPADERAAPLVGRELADVCIVGGGYAGLWTALKLKEREPDLRVSLMERDICGAGASGRNGGFVMSLWVKLGALAHRCGFDDARWLCEQSEQAVHSIGEVCRREGLDADFSHGGWIWAATTPSQCGAWAQAAADARDAGRPDLFVPLDRGALRARTGSPALIAGVLDPTCATVHPAKLARGLRRLALDRGVRIYEHTPLCDLSTSPSAATASSPSGSVTAERIVLAAGAWTPALPSARVLRRFVIPVASDMLTTKRVPAELDALGWTGREAISDSRTLITYLHRTGDGRLAIGKAGGAFAYAGRVGSKFDHPARRVRAVMNSLGNLFPTLRDVGITNVWSGPVDRTPGGLPSFGFLDTFERIAYGVGFSGNGVGPSYLGGEILAALATGADDRWTAQALARGVSDERLPPEPIRFLGGQLVRKAIERAERADAAGRKPSRLVDALTSLAPSGATPKASGSERRFPIGMESRARD